MRVSFFGAAREVTGSNILVEVAGRRILFDCGIFQGVNLAEERNFAPFAYDVKSIDFIVVGHAHLDHVGRLPKIFRDGFRGRIFATAPTCELARLVLDDNQKLMSEEARREERPLLCQERDVDGVMGQFEAIPYGKTLEVFPGVKLTLKNAGHILGSALTILEGEDKKLVYTSDLGNSPCELLEPPDTIESADFVICESTYGGRVHEDISIRGETLNKIINSTISQNGVLMIPTFAIERTQELLHDIEHFCQVGKCEVPRFYLDSPLAEKVTKVFGRYPEFLNGKVKNEFKDGAIFALDHVQITSTVEESKSINNAPVPKIIIAGAGMMNGGRILFHLQKYIEDSKNSILIVGYQAVGTLGRRLVDGEHEIKIFGKKYDVGAQVHKIGSYSAHADQPQLVSWLSKIAGVKKVFLVHGESEESLALSLVIGDKMGVESIIPQQGEEYEL
ncbi:MAG: MBL fold metallo-hydrolase [Candidatus Curtissbacteria bacterium]|nr:MBL fold metallo-hydrolase [Candidatus Curtissbacteria bacterium]